MINLNRLSTEQREQLGLEIRPAVQFSSVEDMFCPFCRQLLKPIRKLKNFRSKGVKWETFQLVASCYQCFAEFDVDHWIEVLFRRREISGLTVIIEQKAEFVIYPQIKYYCVKCDKGTMHSYRSQQTRSADEPETSFYRCTVCGHTTRESI